MAGRAAVMKIIWIIIKTTRLCALELGNEKFLP